MTRKSLLFWKLKHTAPNNQWVEEEITMKIKKYIYLKDNGNVTNQNF